MKITMISSDGVVGVDGEFRSVDMAGLDPTIHAVQFSTEKGKGHVEFRAELEPRRDNLELSDFAPFQTFMDRWTAAAPPPPSPAPAPVDPSDLDSGSRHARALALCVAQIGGLTASAMKTLFKEKFDSLK